MKYTHGPWKAQYLNEGGPIAQSGWEITTFFYDVVRWTEHGAPIRNGYDALLIAAAPEMYELLRAIIIDDPTYGTMVSTDVETIRLAAQLLRRLGELED